jgi:hypothetical protein
MTPPSDLRNHWQQLLAPWDGSEGEAVALVDEAADSTAFLVTRAPPYAWMRSRK